jgi:ABC-2 type transport system ATP-binding protein
MVVPDIVLECQGLRKRFGARVAVDDLSLIVRPGEAYGLLGPNGAGKTTTISMVCGLLGPDEGAVRIAGRPVTTHAAKAAIGYVPQEVALYPALSARENLRYFGRLYGVRGAELTERVHIALEAVGLTERSDERVEHYSGGMKRRANIAAALLHHPSLLVLDEPTVGVDPQSRVAIFEIVERMKDDGLAVLYASHYMEEVERLCDRVGILDRGRLIAEGTRSELLSLVTASGHVDLAVRGATATLARGCRRVARVQDVSVTDGSVRVVAQDVAGVLPGLLRVADRSGVRVTGVRLHEADLETVFLHLTGKGLRD